MVAFRGPKVWLWRWRRNPLRRRSDRIEAWVVLAAWTFTVLGGVVTGLLATRSVEQNLDRQRIEWRPVVAQLTEDAPGAAASSAPGSTRVWAEVRWTARDGSTRTGQTRVAPASAVGTPVTVWTDSDGRMVTEPATRSEARVRSSLIGVLVGVTAAGVPFVGGRLVRGRLERRRMEEWDEEWERVGPLWGRKTW
ncbi:Rv1733c family protein [Streptomyces acidicola]|uniref:Rv1733c family protein n=1 Tax=Streptomyces acidicola TaxID=2596892 RepID=UPI0034370491